MPELTCLRSFSSHEEQIQVNGVDSARTVGVVTAHTIQDVRGLSSAGAFNVDTVLETFQMPNGISQVTIKNNVVTSGQRSFNGVTAGSIVRYTRSGFSTETYNRVVSVANDGSSMSISGITPTSEIDSPDGKKYFEIVNLIAPAFFKGIIDCTDPLP